MPAARGRLAGAIAVKLLLVWALGIALRCPSSIPAGRAKQQQDAREPRPGTVLHRRLLAQETNQAGEPAMAVYGQGQYLPPNSTADGAGSWLLPGLVPVGTELVPAADNIQPTAAACIDSCRQIQRCNTVWFCEGKNGCSSPAFNLSAPYRGCQLVDQEVTKPGTGRPVLVVQAANFTGGAPLRYHVPEVEGYDVHPGLGYWYRYDMTCPDSVSQPGSCGLEGGAQQNAARCDRDPDCQVIMWFPEGRDYPGAGQPVVLLKGAKDSLLGLGDANINLNAVLYKKKAMTLAAEEGSSGGLSATAIAGIVVGACCGAVLVGLLAAFLVQRVRRRREERTVMEGKPPGSSVTVSNGGGSKNSRNGGAGAYESGSRPNTLAFDSASGRGTAALFNSGTGSGGSNGHAQGEAHGNGHVTQIQALPGEQAGAAGMYWQPGISVRVNTAGQSVETEAAAGLPVGDDNSLAAARPAKALARCPATPPPSAGTSIISGVHPMLPRVAYTGPSPPHHQQVLLPGGTPPSALPPGLPRTPRAAAAPHPLLSHLPTYGWQRCAVDYSAIQFVPGPDGLPQELGVGASATVYRVLLNGVEPHAAKVFRLGSDPQAQLYFLEEASTLRLLRHKNVVGFAGVCVAGGSGIILMELMDGGDLRSRNREVDSYGRRVFDWYQRGRRVALDVALALNYLHTSSYTHFDVKSRNVLLSRDLTAKLADVGFARAIRATHHSIEGPTGTFDYMAPELLTGKKCNSSVDIYSYGVLLWELCVGKYPSRGSMREVRVPQECPEAVAELMQECLQEDTAARPTARQLVERLTALQ